jgi:hypothetical protein
VSRTLLIFIAAWLALNLVVVLGAGSMVARRRRMQAAHARPDRRAAAEAYVSILLSRLVVQVCRIQAADRACLLIGSHERGFIVAAAPGVSEDVIGRRAAGDDVLPPTVGGRARRVNLSRIVPNAGAGVWIAIPATTPSNRIVVLCVEPANRVDASGHSEVHLLRHLSALSAAAVEDSDPNGRLEPAVGACAKGLAAVDASRGGVRRPSPIDVVSVASWTGTRLGLDPGARMELQLAACLHGASAVDPAVTARHLARVPGLEVVSLLIELLDERWDGRGRPYGLRGEQIPLATRVLAACSAIRSLTTAPPRGPGESIERALRRVQAASGAAFDPTVVMALSQELMGDVPSVGEIASAASWGRADALYSVLR